MTVMLQPTSLDQALAALAQPGAKALAGGTDLMVQMRGARLAGREAPPILVDLTRLAELKRLDLEGDAPYLGAGVTFAALEDDPQVARLLPLMAQAASWVGSRQVRVTATLGGNTANASPAADGVAALTALGAVAEIASATGQREAPISAIIAAPYKNRLEPGELILGFRLDPPARRAGQVFSKVGRRQAVAVSRLNVAVCLDPDLADPRVVVGSCFPTPRRINASEEMLRGGQPGPELWRAAGAAAAESFTTECGWRSSAVYKVPAVTRVTARALERAWALCQAGGAS